MYNYPVMRQVPPRIVKFDYMEPLSTTTIDVYIYGRQDRNNKYPDNVCTSIDDPVDVKYLYRRPRTSTKTCTTTVAEIARTSTLDLRACENDYFHYYRRGTTTSSTSLDDP